MTERLESRGLVCACLLACAAPAWADAWTPGRGEGGVTVAYQYAHAQRNLLSDGESFDTGSTDSRSALVYVDYGLTDTVAVFVSLPYVQKRFDGPRPHQIQDPNTRTSRRSDEDNGNWHGEFQDWLFGMRRQFAWGEWALTPFVSYGYPSNDYEHLAQAAVGSNQKVLELGVEGGRPVFERSYVQLGYGYSFVESFQGIDVDRSTLTLEAGYIASDRLVLRAFLLGRKTLGGLDANADLRYLPPFVGGQNSRTREDVQIYFHHDQLMRADFVNGGVGAFYRLTALTSLVGSWQGTFWGENTPQTDYSLTIGINRSF